MRSFSLSPCHKATVVAGACIVCLKNCEPVEMQANGYISEANDNSYGKLIEYADIEKIAVKNKYVVANLVKSPLGLSVIYYVDDDQVEKQLELLTSQFQEFCRQQKFWIREYAQTGTVKEHDEDYSNEQEVEQINELTWLNFWQNTVEVGLFTRYVMDGLINFTNNKLKLPNNEIDSTTG